MKIYGVFVQKIHWIFHTGTASFGLCSQVRIDELFEFYTEPKYPNCEPCVLWSIFFRNAKPISPLKLFVGCACFFIPSFQLITLFFVRQLIGKKNGNKTHIFSFPSKLQHLIIYHVSISSTKILRNIDRDKIWYIPLMPVSWLLSFLVKNISQISWDTTFWKFFHSMLFFW